MQRRFFAELSEWDEHCNRRRWDVPWHAELMRFPPFVTVSYAWSAPGHPDGDGRQLCEVLAPAIRWYLCERARLIARNHADAAAGAGAVGGSSDSIDPPGIEGTCTPDGCDFALFVDYSSMWQHDPAAGTCSTYVLFQHAPLRAPRLIHLQRHCA